MRDTLPGQSDGQWGEDPLAAPLSLRGEERRGEILVAMERASERRRVRRRAVRGVAAFAVCSSAAVLTWFAVAPSPRQPVVVVTPKTAPVPPSHPEPSGKGVLVEESRVVVVAEYIGTQRGIAERLSAAPSQKGAVVAQRLSDGALTRVLAEQTSYGVAVIQGEVLVLDNQPSASSPPSVH